MFAKQILTFILCFCLIFSGQSFAAGSSSSLLAELLIQHREIKTGAGALEMISKHGQALADTSFKLMADPKNRNFLNSAEGMELRKHQEMLNNFLAIQNHFKKCVKNKLSKRMLQDRVLQSSLQSMRVIDDSALPCLPPNLNSMTKTYSDFNNGVMKLMKQVVKPNFQNELSQQIIFNTAKSMLAFNQKFSPAFMKGGYLTQKEMDGIVADVCLKKIGHSARNSERVDVCKKMDPKFKLALKKKLIAFSETQKREAKWTPQKATTSLNASIDRLNKTLSKVKVKKDVGLIYDSANLDNEESKRNFEQYVNQYMLEASKEAGPLLLTRTMKQQSGSIKRYDADDTFKNKSTSKFQFTLHQKISEADVLASIEEAEAKMQEQARTILTIAHDATKTNGKIIANDADINELVKINPFAAGQLLLNKPEYTGLMCDSINKINQEDVSDEQQDKYFMVGAAILGGGLLLTGVGTLAGAYLITGSLTAGVAAGTIGGSILGYTALAGSALELASAGYNGHKAIEQYQEMNRLEAAFLTQNTDGFATIEAKNALIEFKDARLSAAISLANVGLSLTTAGKLFNILKSTNAKISPDQIQAAAKILRLIGETQIATRLKNAALLMGEGGLEKVNSFLLYLLSASESTRNKFLELLKNEKTTPEKLAQVIEQALK